MSVPSCAGQTALGSVVWLWEEMWIEQRHSVQKDNREAWALWGSPEWTVVVLRAGGQAWVQVTGQVEEGASQHQVPREARDARGRCREPQTNLLPERPLRRASLKLGGFPPLPFPGPPIPEHANR